MLNFYTGLIRKDQISHGLNLQVAVVKRKNLVPFDNFPSQDHSTIVELQQLRF